MYDLDSLKSIFNLYMVLGMIRIDDGYTSIRKSFPTEAPELQTNNLEQKIISITIWEFDGELYRPVKTEYFPESP